MELPDAIWNWQRAHHVFKILVDDGLAHYSRPSCAMERAEPAEIISRAANSILDRLCQDEQNAMQGVAN